MNLLKNMGLRAKLILGNFIPLVLVVILSIVCYRSIAGLLESNHWVDHTHVVIAEADSILGAAVDMETGARGFLITGKDEFLDPYKNGDQKYHAIVKDLKITVNDNPEQVKLLGEIQETLETWQANIALPYIEMRRSVGNGKTMQDIVDTVGEAKGKQYFDKFRGQIATFTEREQKLMEVRQKEAAELGNNTKNVIIGGTVMGIKSYIKSKLNVNAWLDIEKKDIHKVYALENASRHFDENDELTVHLIEGVYGQESSFGKYRRKRNINGAAGDFQIEKQTAERYGMKISEENDPRFDVDDSSDVAAKYLKSLDTTFSKKTILTEEINSVSVNDKIERKKFVIAAFNGGEGRISMAQDLAKKAGKDPGSWNDVKEYLKDVIATSPEKVKEILEYVEAVLKYEREFEKKSKADSEAKYKTPLKLNYGKEKQGKWITIKGNHVYI